MRRVRFRVADVRSPASHRDEMGLLSGLLHSRLYLFKIRRSHTVCPRHYALLLYVLVCPVQGIWFELRLVRCRREENEPLVLADGQQEPCAEAESAEATTGATKRRKRSRAARALKEKQRCIFAPDCDIGGMRLDDDAMYIHLPDTKVRHSVLFSQCLRFR